MTTQSTDITTATSRFISARRIFQAVSNAFRAHARAASRRDRIEALEAKTDAELAEIGLRRENIVHHVFRDLYYV